MSRIRSSRPSKVTLPPAHRLGDAPPATVLDWLVLRFPKVGRGEWTRRIEEGLVTLDADGSTAASVVTLTQAYAAGRRLRYFREVEQEPDIPFEETLIFEDRHLLVVDKPPFLPVTPSGPFVSECLLERLRARHGPELAPLHRLDRLTTGLVMFSRRPEERGIYGGLFAGQHIRKDYHALAAVAKAPDSQAWTVRSRIVPGEPFFRMAEAESGAINAVTEVRLLRAGSGGAAGLFSLRPLTGKTHQLRLHMARLGWPIQNDPLYPVLREKAPDDPDRPLRLVARRLRFTDPVTGDQRDFESGYDVDALPRRRR